MRPSAGATDTLTLFGLGPHPTVHPAPDTLRYAAAKRWYTGNEVIVIGGRRYAKFGWPMGARPRQPGDAGSYAVPVGEHDGVDVHGVPPLDPYPRRVVVRLNAACRFQPYAEVSEVQ